MSQRSTLTNVVLNLLGFGVPLVLGLLCVPRIISVLGTLRFGFLSVAWVIIGYFSIFDLGLGRALTQAISSCLGSGRVDQIYPLTVKTMRSMVILSLVGGVILFLASPYFLKHVLKIQDDFIHEAMVTMYVLSISIPAVVMFSGFRGILEAVGKFETVAIGRIVLGAWTFLSPLIVFIANTKLYVVVFTLVVGRYAVCYFLMKRTVLEYSKR
ncbi:MATE family efflux transporter [Singulisphaera sp. PoT]|uniref:MATE family efflux transporter n=1 Tax=Singulisphaera sp. PoT TaxID=3411797 RepID=UPI003BF59857